MVEEGAKLVIADINESMTKEVAGQINQKGGTAVSFKVEVAIRTSCRYG